MVLMVFISITFNSCIRHMSRLNAAATELIKILIVIVGQKIMSKTTSDFDYIFFRFILFKFELKWMLRAHSYHISAPYNLKQFIQYWMGGLHVARTSRWKKDAQNHRMQRRRYE